MYNELGFITKFTIINTKNGANKLIKEGNYST